MSGSTENTQAEITARIRFGIEIEIEGEDTM